MKKKYFSPQLLKYPILLSAYLLGSMPLHIASSAFRESSSDKFTGRNYRDQTAFSSVAAYAVPGQLLFAVDGDQALHDSTTESANKTTPQSVSHLSKVLAQNEDAESTVSEENRDSEQPKTMFINFNNISIIEYLRFISRNINKNFIFDENDLQFNVTIVSEEPATFDNIMTALLQELRIHDLSLLEQGNNLIIHKNPKVNAVSQVVTEENPQPAFLSEIITQVFKLNTADPQSVASIIKPLTSDNALVEVLAGTNHIIITDLRSNVEQIAKLIKSIDSPQSGLVIGQYVVKTMAVDLLMDMAQKIISPIAQEQPLSILAWEPSNSIFIISNPFIVERALSILQHIDQREQTTKIYNPKEWIYKEEKSTPMPPAGLFFQNEPYLLSTPAAQIPGAAGTLGAPSETSGFDSSKSGGSLGQFNFPRADVLGGLNPYGEEGPLTNTTEHFPNIPKEKAGEAGSDSQEFGAPGTFNASSGGWLRRQGQWAKSPSGGSWTLELPPTPGTLKSEPPRGNWKLNDEGLWFFEENSKGTAGGYPIQGWTPAPAEGTQGTSYSGYHPESLPIPKGQWILQPSGAWSYALHEGESITVTRVGRPEQETALIPLGPKKESHFYLYKLRFRKGAAIQKSLFAIAESLQKSEYPNEVLIATLMSAQWLESSNALMFAGDDEVLDKIRILMEQVDMPLRQVFIEMLILELDVADSLQYGVNWESRFGGSGNNWAGAEGFRSVGLTNINPLDNAMNQTGGTTTGLPGVPQTIMSGTGFNLGVVGQKIVNNALGIEFSSIGALVQAVRSQANSDIILNPKIITEDSVPAEIFVGENVAFRTQSIANDQGNTITSNFEYRDIGTRMRVTPIIGENNLITLEISQETSRIIPSPLNATDNSPGPNTTKSTTTTRVHLPDGYFLVISGMINNQKDRTTQSVPCLGGIPLLGAAFKDVTIGDSKRNQMIFLRPQIIDTVAKLQDLTKHQQDVWIYKRQQKKDWVYETEEALSWMNIRRNPNVESTPDFDPYYNNQYD